MLDEKPFAFVVYGQPATKKNSAVMVARRATILPSKPYREYEKKFRAAMRKMKMHLGELPHYDGPVQLTAKYYLESRAHYPDLSGLLQATQDIISDEYAMVLDRATGKRKRQRRVRWILSDDRIVKSLDGCRIAGIDKERPRVEIYITPLPLDPETETDPQLIKLARAMLEQDLLAEGAAMDELKYNAEHYRDKTAQQAVRQVDYEADMARLNAAIKAAQHIFHDYGFHVVERIVLEDKRTGKIYR